MGKNFGENFKFHINLDITRCSLDNFPRFYKEILTLWSKYYSFLVSLPSAISSQFLWFNKYIKVDGFCIYFRYFSWKGFNFLEQWFDLEGKLENWTTRKTEYQLIRIQEFLVDTISRCFKDTLETIYNRTKYRFSWS